MAGEIIDVSSTEIVSQLRPVYNSSHGLSFEIKIDQHDA
jgi:hypothetical protein